VADRVLVTGGAGFVGLHLCRRLLADGLNVVVVDNLSRHGADPEFAALLREVHFVDHDLTEGMPASVPGRCDAVFHLAAWVGVGRVARHPYQVLRDNIDATGAVLDWCAQHPVGTVFLSSTSEVADGAGELGLVSLPLPEAVPFALTSPHSARSSYALSKLVAEALLLHRGGARIRIGRYYNVYGPRMGSEHVIPQFIERALRGMDPFPIYGAANTRAFCYVSDAVDASVRLASLPTDEPVLANIGDDRCEISMMELAERVFRAVGLAPSVEVHAPPAGSPARRVPDLTLLRSLTGYQPRVPLDEGIAATCRWYADRPRARGAGTAV